MFVFGRKVYSCIFEGENEMNSCLFVNSSRKWFYEDN